MASIKQLLRDIEASPDGPQVAAIFDFDGTIIAGYSATAFIREQVRPHLDSGQLKVGRLYETVAAEEDREIREFYDERVGKLDQWMKRARMMLPLMQKVLGQ